MKKQLLYHSTFILFLLGAFIISSAFIKGDKQFKSTSGGDLTFTVRTVAAPGNYSPKHVLAIWIEDDNGFVKTRKLRGNSKKQYLYTWVAASNYNVVDAITGSTLTSHQTHTVSWDCTDLSGNIVPDGDYTVFTEFTSAHAQGPLTSVTFTKGPDAISLNLPDETYFKDMVLSFTPFTADFSSDVTSICQMGTVTFTDQSVNATSWAWDFGEGAAPATSNTQGPHTVYFTTPGLKTVSLTINGSITETKSDVINVGINPTAAYEYYGNLFQATFLNNSTDATSYLWDFGDGETSTDENPVHIYSTAGSYTVALTATQESCEDVTSQVIEVPMTGVNDITLDAKTYISPNPGNGTFKICSEDYSEIQGIEILNQEGKLIQKATFDKNVLTPAFKLNSEDKGLYFVKIIRTKSIIIKKLIVL